MSVLFALICLPLVQMLDDWSLNLMISSKSKLMVNKFDPARTEQSIFKIQYLIGLSAELIDPVRGFCPILFVDLFHCDSLSGLSK